MTYEIHFERNATKGQRGIDRQALAKILAAVDALADEPRPEGVKALTGPLRGHYRLSITAIGGHYRVLYRIEDATQQVIIENLGARENFY